MRDGHPRVEPDPSDVDGVWWEDPDDPLAAACLQLNFEHSLVEEADRLHRRTLRILEDLAEAKQESASLLAEAATSSRSGAARDRLRGAADRSLVGLAATRARHSVLAGLDLASPRPPELPPPAS